MKAALQAGTSPHDLHRLELPEDLLEEKGAGEKLGGSVDRLLEDAAANLEAPAVSAVELLEEEVAEAARRRSRSFDAAEEGVVDDQVEEAMEEPHHRHPQATRRRA